MSRAVTTDTSGLHQNLNLACRSASIHTDGTPQKVTHRQAGGTIELLNMYVCNAFGAMVDIGRTCGSASYDTHQHICCSVGLSVADLRPVPTLH